VFPFTSSYKSMVPLSQESGKVGAGADALPWVLSGARGRPAALFWRTKHENSEGFFSGLDEN